ncbi:MAG: caspase family protein [Saprospiraceae bacterium]
MKISILNTYYSGHGHYDEDIDEGFWIPVNARPSDESSYISNANIVKRLNVLDTRHTLLIVDSCFSGSLVVKKRTAIPDERFKSRRILASGRYETASDGEKGKNSPFAAGLLTMLRKNTSPKLDTTSLIKYVKDYVHGKANQHPVEGRLQNSADEGGEFVFYLKRDEEAVWKEVTHAHSVVAYRNYIAGFPDGKYVEAANRKINELEEDKIWQQATINDNELSYEGYLQRFTPLGKYLAQASERLEALKKVRQARQEAQEKAAARDEERQQWQQQFEAHIKQAEQLYKERELIAAREAYREALRSHLPGFVPTQAYIEEQINFCQHNITFLGHYENGKAAMQEGNFRLAIEYYQEALKIKHNQKIEQLIQHCQQQMQQQRTGGKSSNSFVPPNHAPVKKKNNVVKWIAVGMAALVILALAINHLIPQENYPTDEQYIADPNWEDAASENDESTHTAPETYSILGSWQLLSVEWMEGGNAYDATSVDPTLAALINGVYHFYDNGVVTFTSVYQTTNNMYYSAGGSNIHIQAPGYGPGIINHINDSQLVVTLPFSNGYGQYYLRFSMERME